MRKYQGKAGLSANTRSRGGLQGSGARGEPMRASGGQTQGSGTPGTPLLVSYALTWPPMVKRPTPGSGGKLLSAPRPGPGGRPRLSSNRRYTL